MSEIKDVVCNVCEEYRASIICLKCRKPTCLNCIIIESIPIIAKYHNWNKEINKCTQCIGSEKKEEDERKFKQKKDEKESLNFFFLISILFLFFFN